MTAAFVQGRTSQGNGTSPSLAYSSSVVSGNLLVAGVSEFQSNTTTVNAIVSTNGTLTSRTAVLRNVGVGQDIQSRTAYGVAASSAAATVSSSFTGGSGLRDYRISIAEYSGLTGTPFDQSIDGSGSAATHVSGNTPSTTQANELVVVFDTHGTTDTATNAAAAGYTKRATSSDESTTNMPAFWADKSVSSTGVQSASVTWENGPYICTVMTFKETVTATTAPPPPRSPWRIWTRR